MAAAVGVASRVQQKAAKHPVKPRGCGNQWADKYCHKMLDHCDGHPVLRWKCQDACGACNEKFNFYNPGNGREIAILSNKEKAVSAEKIHSSPETSPEKPPAVKTTAQAPS